MPYKDKKKQNEYWARYRKKEYQRYRIRGNCINCGLPCAPYWRCKKHRLRVSKYNRKQYLKRKNETRST